MRIPVLEDMDARDSMDRQRRDDDGGSDSQRNDRAGAMAFHPSEVAAAIRTWPELMDAYRLALLALADHWDSDARRCARVACSREATATERSHHTGRASAFEQCAAGLRLAAEVTGV
jgi:hypothetical protein